MSVPLFNMAQYCIGRAAGETPDAPALLVVDDIASAAAPSEIWTFRDIDEAVRNIAAGLQSAGLSKGARILIRLENTSTYALLFFGAIAGGYVPLPTSGQLTSAEVEFLLHDSGAEAIAISDEMPVSGIPPSCLIIPPDVIEEWIEHGKGGSYAETSAEDPAYLIYTSGTTAKPKGVLHAQRSVLGRRPTIEIWYDLKPTDRMLHAGAFNWTYTLGTGLSDPWAGGATSIIYTGEKSPEIWPRLVAATGATLFAAVPSVYRQILKYAGPIREKFVSLRHCLMAGETPPHGLIDAWEEATGRPIYEALGMSEISTYISTGPTVPRKAGTVGKPQPGRRVAILPPGGGTEPMPIGTEGVIAVHRSDPGLMLGYWNRPDDEAEVYRGDWFIGGDLGIMDDEGYVAHTGRANDIMKALGYRVSPLEVEAAIAQCPGVAEVACTEVRVREDVSVIGAFIVKTNGAKLTAEKVSAFAANQLAPYKCPREIVFVDSLPRTANGKVKRSALTAHAADHTTG